MEVNRKLFLLSDVYGIFTYSDTLDQIESFEKAKKEFESVLVKAKRFEIMLIETEQDTTEVEDMILKVETQLIYVQQNINTFLDALSLCEQEVVHDVYLTDANAWVEICNN